MQMVRMHTTCGSHSRLSKASQSATRNLKTPKLNSKRHRIPPLIKLAMMLIALIHLLSGKLPQKVLSAQKQKAQNRAKQVVAKNDEIYVESVLLFDDSLVEMCMLQLLHFDNVLLKSVKLCKQCQHTCAAILCCLLLRPCFPAGKSQKSCVG